MNVVLIGYRGTGKSSVAELVAMATNRDTVHLDDEIVRQTGTSIAAFVENHSWEAFHEVEREVVRTAAARDNVVIDTGGGVVRSEDNMALLKRDAVTFWLRAASETIKERIREEQEHRPSITGTKNHVDEVEEVLEARTPLYERHADYSVDTDGRTLSEIANDIIEILCS